MTPKFIFAVLQSYFLSAKMVLCTVQIGFSHDLLAPAISCPFCSNGPDNVSNTPSETISSVSRSTATTAATTAPTTASTTAPTTAPTTAVTTPASSVFIPTAHRAITTVQASRARAISLARTPSQPPLDDIRLLVKVAHAVFQQGSSIPTFTLFTESWPCTITPGKLYMDYKLTSFILNDGRNVNLPFNLPHWDVAVWPSGEGDWTLAANHLTTVKSSPQLYRPWRGEIRIEDIINLQGYHLRKKGIAYPTTLIWYPNRFHNDGDPSIYISDNDDDLPSLKALFSGNKGNETVTEPPTAPPPAAPDSDSNTKHKRKISTAIPTRERPNTREKDTARGDDDVAVRGDDDVAVRGNNDVAPRRSGRARKTTAKGLNVE
jgi:hypothetical protein